MLLRQSGRAKPAPAPRAPDGTPGGPKGVPNHRPAPHTDTQADGLSQNLGNTPSAASTLGPEAGESEPKPVPQISTAASRQGLKPCWFSKLDVLGASLLGAVIKSQGCPM